MNMDRQCREARIHPMNFAYRKKLNATKTLRKTSLHGLDTYLCCGFYLKGNGSFIFAGHVAQNSQYRASALQILA